VGRADGRTHEQALADGTRLRLTVKSTPSGSVARFEIDGSACTDTRSPFCGLEQEVVSLIEGEDATDRGTVAPGALDLLVPQTVLDGDAERPSSIGVALAGRAPRGATRIRADGVEAPFGVDQASGLFCAARWWANPRRPVRLRVRADDPTIATLVVEGAPTAQPARSPRP